MTLGNEEGDSMRGFFWRYANKSLLFRELPFFFFFFALLSTSRAEVYNGVVDLCSNFIKIEPRIAFLLSSNYCSFYRGLSNEFWNFSKFSFVWNLPIGYKL